MQNVRTALKRFEKYGFITNESTKAGRLITICNWELYQSPEEVHNKESPSPLTDGQQTTNRPLTPNKNNKNDKNEKNERSKAAVASLLPEDEWYDESQTGRGSI